ncbi:MAG: hypothetical protein EGR43_09930 [Prevotella sp.]|nr:hypothetical protein [Prevotella sp.]
MQHQGRVSQDRVLYRGNNNANPNGGVSYTNANNDASNSNANLGSRLDYCFIGSTAPPTCRHRSDRGRCAALME